MGEFFFNRLSSCWRPPIWNVYDSVFATSVPLSHSDNTACAAFTSTPERAHQKSSITFADVSEISASEHEIGKM
jgi:hypothetical protein